MRHDLAAHDRALDERGADADRVASGEQTSFDSTAVPTSPSIFSTRISVPGSTRYCLPPVRMTANAMNEDCAAYLPRKGIVCT